MGPVYYVIAILGCGDGSVQCSPAATVPTQYSTHAACEAATQDALIANSDLDFPTLVAECRSIAAPVSASASENSPQQVPTGALRS